MSENIIKGIADNEARELRSALAKDIGTRRASRLEELKKFFGREDI